MKQPKKSVTVESRRGFLKGIAVAGAGTIAAGGAGAALAVTESAPQAVEESRGYRLTDHVLAYYRAAAL